MKKLSDIQRQELDAHLRVVAKILYENTPEEKLQTFEAIELELREQILTEVGPKLGNFLPSRENKLWKTTRHKQLQ